MNGGVFVRDGKKWTHHRAEDFVDLSRCAAVGGYMRCSTPSNQRGEYRGCQSKTKSGRTCQDWTKTKPQKPGDGVLKDIKAKRFGLGPHNYCRDAELSGYIWCYTTDPKKRWEDCHVPEHEDDSCLGTGEYRGSKSVTLKGYTCQRWTEYWPHKPGDEVLKDIKAGRFGLGSHNYCRDGENSGRIWCYTTNPDVRYDYC